MSIWSDIRRGFTAPPLTVGVPESDAMPVRTRAIGRITTTGSATINGLDAHAWSMRSVIPPPHENGAWAMQQWDSDALNRLSPSKLLETLADLSPDVSRALWDFLRLCNPGWEAKALKFGGDTVDTRGQAALDTFLDTLDDLYGSVDVVFGRLYIGAFLRGAFYGEIVMDASGKLPIDFATPDPAAARFRYRDDPTRGRVWQLCQIKTGAVEPENITSPTVRYIPVDPFPGSPYGRSLASPAVFVNLFLLTMLLDIRRVVRQQGYPRLDVTADLGKLLSRVPAQYEGDDEKTVEWINAQISDVVAVYDQLEPDSAFFHSDEFTINRPVGAVDSSSLGAIDGLITALERMSMRALKSNKLLWGTEGASSEGQSNRLYESHIQSIKALQHLCETLLERLLTLGLRAQGIVASVEFRFAENRVAEMLRDEQVQTLKLNNANTAYDRGYISQDQAANMALGLSKADVPEPRSAIAQTGMVVGGQPDPGEGR